MKFHLAGLTSKLNSTISALHKRLFVHFLPKLGRGHAHGLFFAQNL